MGLIPTTARNLAAGEDSVKHLLKLFWACRLNGCKGPLSNELSVAHAAAARGVFVPYPRARLRTQPTSSCSNLAVANLSATRRAKAGVNWCGCVSNHVTACASDAAEGSAKNTPVPALDGEAATIVSVAPP